MDLVIANVLFFVSQNQAMKGAKFNYKFKIVDAITEDDRHLIEPHEYN